MYSEVMKKSLLCIVILLLASVRLPAQKLVGGDISLLPSYEEKGAKYLDHEGNAIDELLPFLKQQGWNALRVRLFVNPDNATDEEKEQGVAQSLDYVMQLGKRIKQAGFYFMLDFHYSDTWADPAKQWTPADWQGLSDDELGQKLYEYTKKTLTELSNAGATPDYIQTGNEISYGMLWGPRGTTANRCYIDCSDTVWNRFTTLLQQAVKACREVCPQAKVILHSERSGDATTLLDFLGRMQTAGVDYDILGLSYYPYYHGPLSTLSATLSQVAASYPDREIMIVETGYPAHWKIDDAKYEYTDDYPYTDAGQKKFTDDLITRLKGVEKVTGLFWWWPEANEYGIDYSNHVTAKWYNSTLFDNETGCAYSSLSELQTFLEGGTNGITAVETTDTSRLYNLSGMPVKDPAAPGVYIRNHRKVVVK